MADMKSGMNMRSEDQGTMPASGKIAALPGNPLSSAVAMVSKQSERGDHSANVCGYKMEDRMGM